MDNLTLRDYFVAHAPKEILWQFDIDISDMGEAPTIKAELGWQIKQNIYDAEVNRRRYIKWPFIWTNEMLKQRNAK